MKAIRVHGPRDVRYEDVPEPQTGPDDVLIRIKAPALCGTDLDFYDGTMFYITSGMTALPLIPGHEWAGEVVAIGSNVHEFAPGDRVTG
jgi:threonine dehydrogenase-like Zn-dependent dehydrogenase